MGDPSLPDDLRIELAKSLQMNLFTKASLGGAAIGSERGGEGADLRAHPRHTRRRSRDSDSERRLQSLGHFPAFLDQAAISSRKHGTARAVMPVRNASPKDRNAER